MKKIILLAIYINLLAAQIQYGGSPIFYNQQFERINSVQINPNTIIDRNFDPMVFQFGREYLVEIDVMSEAELILNQDNTYTLLLSISSEGAYGLGLNFSDFYLSPNASLFFYDEERTNYLGAFTKFSNKESNELTTSIIKSDRIIIELTFPINEFDQNRLYLNTVIHDYTDIMNYHGTLDENREDCNTNVICSEGDDWRDQINGVVRVSMGGGLCSASLINNTQNDRTPYILFADHCVSGAASGYVFYFNYQSSSCTGTSGSLNQSVSGSNLLVSEDINSGPDFALLELTSNVPDSYNPYYVGWSRLSLPPQEAVGIHHPGGDIKKISFTNDNVSAGGSGGYYWEFQYDNGRVIPGSSGSPFFDENKRQVGIASYIYTNYCDPSPDCYCSQQYSHGYGRFDQAMNLGMASFLDPTNSGVTFIDGISISGINIVHDAYEDIPFLDDNLIFTADVSAYTGVIDAVELYYNIGEGFVSQEMSPGINNFYSTSLDGLYEGMLIEYYIMAVNSEGIVQTFPASAPDNSILFVLGDLPDIYFNDFENNIDNWQIGDINDSATAGIWELAEPLASYNDQGFLVQSGQDDSQDGTYCFVTGNGFQIDETTGENSASFDDVDGGQTTLLTPNFNLSIYDEVVLTFSRWYTNDIGDNGNTDSWKVQASNDDGQSWIDIENTSVSNASWIKSRFILSNFIDFTENVQFKFIAEDILNNGDVGSGGSLVEAAIDNFLLEYALTDPLILGDVNLDFVVNILDVIILVNMVLGFEQPNLAQGDINSDSQINILDVVGLVSLILDN